MMNGHQPLKELERRHVKSALAAGTLEMVLGPFSARLKGYDSRLLDFLYDTYRDVSARTELSDVTDIAITVKSPSYLRKYFRPQVVPDPGFQVPAAPLPASMSSLALEMGMNLVVALKCCRYVMFHAGVVAGENGAIIVSANSGGGKSTLIAALMQEGYKLFSDEFGLLGLDDPSFTSYPRPVSLKNESIDIVKELSGSEWISPVLTETPKGNIAYRRARPTDVAAAGKTAKGKIILFPKFNPNGDHYAQRLSSSEAMLRLIPSSTNYHLLGEKAYRALTALVTEAEAFEIGYRNTEESMVIVRDIASGVTP